MTARSLAVIAATVALAMPHASVAGAHPAPSPADAFAGFGLVASFKKDGVENTEMAFMGSTAFVGSNSGFRVFDIARSGPPRLLADVPCRAGRHGDLSVFEGSTGRRYLIQSIDRPQTAPDCTGTDTTIITEDEHGAPVQRGHFGYEGLRLFDVTVPARPRFERFIATACGSHTHTQVPDRHGRTLHVYVASYPYGRELGITPTVDLQRAGDLACLPPHGKISIVDLPLRDPTRRGRVREQRLSADTAMYDPDGPAGTGEPWRACHDLQAFLARDVMVASCTADAQIWSLRDRGDPTAGDGEPHTHITIAPYHQISDSVVTWDGRVVAIRDNTGISQACEGAASTVALTNFYPLVSPGSAAPAPLGRYSIPRPQAGEFCGSWYGNVIPTFDGRRLMVQAFQQGGTSLYDFTQPSRARELAFVDIDDAVGRSDDYAAYWYNGRVYVNGGLARRDNPGLSDGNRGFEVYELRDDHGRPVRAKRWRLLNPQTQERWQAP